MEHYKYEIQAERKELRRLSFTRKGIVTNDIQSIRNIEPYF